MRTTDEVHVVFLQEARNYVRPKCEANTSIVLAPARDVFVRVGPQQIAEKTAVGDLYMSAFALQKLQSSS